MSIWNIYNPADAVGSAVVTAVSATRITSTYSGENRVRHVDGAFVMSGDAVVGGTIHTIEEHLGGQLALRIADLNVPVIQYFGLSNAGDFLGLANLMLSGPDQMWGSTGADGLGGLDGPDTIIALDGTDTVVGGTGADDVNGNVGQDLVFGGDGDDIVRGGRDNDTLYGDAGDDPHVNGNLGDDSVSGGAGNDTVYGGQGQDTLLGGDGADLLSGDLGNDHLYGGAGADRFVLRAGTGVDWVIDFRPQEGDRVQLAAGATYTVSAISNQVVIDLGGGDLLALAAVTTGFSADWIVFG